MHLPEWGCISAGIGIVNPGRAKMFSNRVCNPTHCVIEKKKNNNDRDNGTDRLWTLTSNIAPNNNRESKRTWSHKRIVRVSTTYETHFTKTKYTQSIMILYIHCFLWWQHECLTVQETILVRKLGFQPFHPAQAPGCGGSKTPRLVPKQQHTL